MLGSVIIQIIYGEVVVLYQSELHQSKRGGQELVTIVIRMFILNNEPYPLGIHKIPSGMTKHCTSNVGLCLIFSGVSSTFREPFTKKLDIHLLKFINGTNQ